MTEVGSPDAKTYTYSCISVVQRHDGEVPRQVLFSAPAQEILEWARVDRLTIAPADSGNQRLLNKAKVRAIARFLKGDARNTIPNAVTIALADADIEGEEEGPGILTIRPSDGNVVIDGQHRLFGMSEFSPEMPANVVAIVGPDDTEIAFQFLVINNKVTKVSPDHIRLLTSQLDQGALSERLKTARLGQGQAALVVIVDNADDSPFYESVIWPTEDATSGDRKNLVRPASIEVALSSISSKHLPGIEEDDALIGFFFALWQPVKERWPQLWTENSKLLGKVGLVTLTQFLVDDLAPLVDREMVFPSDPDSVTAEVKDRILTSLDPGFWSSDWTESSLDTTAGRRIVVDALTKMRRNVVAGRPWSDDIALIAGATSLVGDE